MTDEQVLEIYGFARDVFKGGQEYFLVEALPFRMTPENWRGTATANIFEFWKMLKVGYDHFRTDQASPQGGCCERQYVFNQVPQIENAAFQASASCPPASVPTTLASAHYAYEQSWNANFLKAVDKFEREEARQIAANEAKAEADARRAQKEAELAARMAANGAQAPSVPVLSLFSTGNPLKALAPQSQPATPMMSSPEETAAPSAAEDQATGDETAPAPSLGGVPVPVPNPAASAAVESAQQQPQSSESEKPFWKIWSKN